jgi:dolichol kinase
MTIDVKNTAILASSFLALFGVAEVLYHKFHVKAEITRKFVHAVTGLLTLLFPVLLNNRWLVLLLCTGFAAILIFSLRFNLIKSINAIDRKSHGTISYPVAVFGCYLAFEYSGNNYDFYYLPILTLAFCDPLAALVGKTWPYGRIRNKTVMGSFAFFVGTVVLGFVLHQSIVTILIIAVVATIAEAVTPKGLDNLSIPASVLLVLFIGQELFR